LQTALPVVFLMINDGWPTNIGAQRFISALRKLYRRSAIYIGAQKNISAFSFFQPEMSAVTVACTVPTRAKRPSGTTPLAISTGNIRLLTNRSRDFSSAGAAPEQANADGAEDECSSRLITGALS